MIQQHPQSKLLPQRTTVKKLPTRAIAERAEENTRLRMENDKQRKELIKNQNASSFAERLRIFKTSTK